jgi:hypothetical protein
MLLENRYATRRIEQLRGDHRRTASLRDPSRRTVSHRSAKPRTVPMKTYEALIHSTSPLLTDRFNEDCLDDATRHISKPKPTPQEQAERSVYRDPQNRFALPTAGIARMLREAGSNHKTKGSRRSIKFIVPCAIRFPNEFAPLTNGDGKTPIESYTVDARSTVTRATGGRRMCYRARFENWSIKFCVLINESLLDPSLVRTLLIEGGEQRGLGSFRAEKGGPFGTFEVLSWGESK